MARDPELMRVRNQSMRREYTRLRRRRTSGTAIRILADRYYISERRVQDIVWSRQV